MRFRAGDDEAQLVEDRFEDRGQQLLTGAEVVVDRGLGEAHFVGDHLQRGARETVPGEQVDGDIDQALTGIGSARRLHRERLHT